MNPITAYQAFPLGIKIILIVIFAIIASLIVKLLKKLSKRLFTFKLGKKDFDDEVIVKKYPKFASLTTIFVSAITFLIYFLAAGLVLKQFNVSLSAYLASASIIGLALAFGSQGFVQDVVTGLTLIFSDALNIQDIVEISGQIGKVESIGLRFTTLRSLQGGKIFIPNRIIGIIGRYNQGYFNIYVDIQLPENSDEKEIVKSITNITEGIYVEFKHIMKEKPEIIGVLQTTPNNWHYLKIRFKIYPGQVAIVDSAFKQRAIASMKKYNSDYTDWMITVHF